MAAGCVACNGELSKAASCLKNKIVYRGLVVLSDGEWIHESCFMDRCRSIDRSIGFAQEHKVTIDLDAEAFSQFAKSKPVLS
jgi:hypothetical protein